MLEKIKQKYESKEFKKESNELKKESNEFKKESNEFNKQVNLRRMIWKMEEESGWVI